jgi:hypothetical protein
MHFTKIVHDIKELTVTLDADVPRVSTDGMNPEIT